MDVRDTVLDAALQIISTDGPDAVSMREVARRSGVSHQAPYHHFGDRAGIFAAITEAGFEMLADKFAAVLTTDRAPARRCFEAYVSMAVENPAHFRVMFRRDICGLESHDSARAAGDSAYAELLKMVERTIGRPAGERESVTWATLMWSSAHGLATLLVDGPLEAKLPEGVSVADHIDDVVSLMTEMVERQAASMGLTPVR
ncbi:MAG: TetR/AcrR family transcriptional regulator [Ilumatobacteraceae bacterium]|jgi:AcrR family transcriptional regulator